MEGNLHSEPVRSDSSLLTPHSSPLETAAEMGRLVAGLVTSYEAGVQAVEAVVEAADGMLEPWKREREEVRSTLRETLAKGASLRRKDFDAMMRGLLLRQEERELEVKEVMKAYLKEQKEAALALKAALNSGDPGRLRAALGQVQAWQREKEEEVRRALVSFQREQEEVASAFKELLAKGSIRAKDLKAAIERIQTRREAWER
ncbi:MAG: hypothetical protein ACK4Z6_03955 [Candidatus Methylomirabilales bacterium]